MNINLYEFLRGPMASMSVAVFLGGTLFQLFRFLSASRPVRRIRYSSTPPLRNGLPRDSVRLAFAFAWARFRQTAWGRTPVMASVTTLFHAGIIGAVFFQVGHNVLLDQSWGVSLPCFAEAVTDGLTLLVLAACGFFLGRRLFVAQVRALSTAYDHVVLALVALPFLTGLLAFHGIFEYQSVVLLHMASGELVLMAIPFTKLMHAFYFMINRFLLPGEHSFIKRGVRAW